MDSFRNLFVYGTLMTSAKGELGKEQRRRLRREATLLGSATVLGRLYDLGGYPGVVLTGDEGAIVHGELFELKEPEATFFWLDPYEDVSLGGSPSGLYRRVTTVAVINDERVPCWIYELTKATRGMKALPQGRWPALSG